MLRVEAAINLQSQTPLEPSTPKAFFHVSNSHCYPQASSFAASHHLLLGLKVPSVLSWLSTDKPSFIIGASTGEFLQHSHTCLQDKLPIHPLFVLSHKTFLYVSPLLSKDNSFIRVLVNFSRTLSFQQSPPYYVSATSALLLP